MSDFEARLNDVLVGIFNSILRYEEQSLKAISSTPVTINEAHVLEVIGKQNHGITVSEIASALSISAPTATVAVKRLESKGFITKTTCADDGRKFLIGLTDTGERINRAHGLFHRKMVRSVSQNLSEPERDVLISAVMKLGVFFKEKVDT